jgi:hypothetical protein
MKIILECTARTKFDIYILNSVDMTHTRKHGRKESHLMSEFNSYSYLFVWMSCFVFIGCDNQVWFFPTMFSCMCHFPYHSLLFAYWYLSFYAIWRTENRNVRKVCLSGIDHVLCQLRNLIKVVKECRLRIKSDVWDTG